MPLSDLYQKYTGDDDRLPGFSVATQGMISSGVVRALTSHSSPGYSVGVHARGRG